jgi:hypothetical protein
MVRSALLITSILASALAGTARADNAVSTSSEHEPARWRFVLEIDPINYAVRGGWSATAFVRPGPLPHWRFGASIYAGDLPSFAMEEGWAARIEPGMAVHAQYFLSRDAKGFFLGALASLNRWDYTFEGMSGSARVDEVSVMPAIGYQWFPFGDGLVIKPWLGVGIPLYARGEATLGTETHDRAIPVAPFATLHLGYQF